MFKLPEDCIKLVSLFIFMPVSCVYCTVGFSCPFGACSFTDVFIMSMIKIQYSCVLVALEVKKITLKSKEIMCLQNH